MADTTVAELNRLFATGDQQLQPDVVFDLESTMRMHQLSPEDLFYKWESYCIKMDMDNSNLNITTARALKQDIQDALEKSNRTQAHVKQDKRPAATPRAAVKGDVFGILDGLTPTAGKPKGSGVKKRPFETPSVSRVKGDVPSSSPGHESPMRMEDQLGAMSTLPPSSFNERPNPGELVEVLNDHLPAAVPPIAPYPKSRINLVAYSDKKKLSYKPLAMKLSEASEILDVRIDEFRDLVQDYHKLDDSVFGSAAAQSTAEIVAVGRIASDSPEGKLNAASLVLETSRRTGGGLRVPLNMGKFRGYAFFPGQIVALRGANASGHEFIVHDILDLPLLKNAGSPPEALEAVRAALRGDPDAMDEDSDPPPLNVIFASGPYTADDNLDFEPLHALCSLAADTLADAVVLQGPFLDADHPLVATGDFDLPDDTDPDTATMATAFRYLISPALNRLAAANPSATLILVPSVRDVVDKHVAWPQDAFPRKDLGLPRAARVVSNPMTLAVNEAVVGLSSQDVLYELRHEELAAGRPADPVLLSRLARHLVEQRHFFPLFPPADRRALPKVGAGDGLATGAMLDPSYLKLGEMVDVRPDVLVVPSALPPFVKVVESVLVINPGYLSKRRGAGTYARMTLYPPSTKQAEDDSGLLTHKIFDRARVEITRI